MTTKAMTPASSTPLSISMSQSMLLDPDTVQQGIDVADKKTEGFIRMRWTKEMDEDWEEFLAHEKEHPTIDVPPAPLPEEKSS